ncbi:MULTISPECIES: hypothetical protein [unclassified Streptomyces]|uniref:hypothetical protein n=1 Tax=unclassified Streptomyces TaxID=2593676 RepID=UPI00035DFDD3|nr:MULTISPECIES: hypothetical protein [unclassified Streptomyces]MYT28075.1 hypothetical protein [Streptomyces sp. SID8354]
MAEQRGREPGDERERGRDAGRTRDEERGREATEEAAPENGKPGKRASGPSKGKTGGPSGLFPTFSHRDE